MLPKDIPYQIYLMSHLQFRTLMLFILCTIPSNMNQTLACKEPNALFSCSSCILVRYASSSSDSAETHAERTFSIIRTKD